MEIRRRERHRHRVRGCLTGIILYAMVVTSALIVVIIIYGSRIWAEAGSDDLNARESMPQVSWEDGSGVADTAGSAFLENENTYHADPDCWNMMLVNKWNLAPEGYEVELAEAEQGYQVDARVAEDLMEMLEAARAEGLSPRICSAYRSHEKQIRLYNKKVREYLNKGYATAEAEEEAGKWVAVPGTSEHETGLAVDLVAVSYQILDEGQEDTKEQQWLMENCYKYGFILRYPNEKSEITGIYYEPWHYRYVGKEAAAQMYELGICFEEYREMLLEN